MKPSILFLLPVAALLWSCKDDDNGNKPDTEKPVINLVSPAAGTSMYSNNTTLQISGTVTDNVEIGEIHVELLDLTSGLANPYLIHHHIHAHSATASFDTTYTFTVATHTDYKVRIQADDVNGNTGITERNFHVMP